MLLIIGDSDIVRPEHAVEAFRLLGVVWKVRAPGFLAPSSRYCRELPTSPSWSGLIR